MRIGIVGLGLIGGSMAKAFKANTQHIVCGSDIRESEQLAALLYESIDEALTNINLCDAVIICTYPQGVVEFVTNNAANFKKDALIVDCTGVKREVCDKIRPIAQEFELNFIGGHPMAGKQFSGFKSSSAHLFKDATMLLTPYEDTPIKHRENARDLFLSAGFKKVHFTTAQEHDKKIAYTSQLAHIVSNAYIKSPTSAQCKDHSAGSFRDMTRVAKLNAPMWTELFVANADYLSIELDILISNLQKYSTAIKNHDGDSLRELLEWEVKQ